MKRNKWMRLSGLLMGLTLSGYAAGTVQVEESWCEIQCPEMIFSGESFEVRVTFRGVDENLQAGCVLKAISANEDVVGVVGRARRIKGIRNDREYAMMALVEKMPEHVNKVSCYLTLSTDGTWENRVHEVRTPFIQVASESQEKTLSLIL